MAEPTAATHTETITGSVERENISPAQFLAELEAQGVKTTVEETPAEAQARDRRGRKARSTARSPPRVRSRTRPKVRRQRGQAGRREGRREAGGREAGGRPARGEARGQRRGQDGAEDLRRRGRKEASALKHEQENKQLKGTIRRADEARNEDPLALLRRWASATAPRGPVKDLLRGVVARARRRPRRPPTSASPRSRRSSPPKEKEQSEQGPARPRAALPYRRRRPGEGAGESSTSSTAFEATTRFGRQWPSTTPPTAVAPRPARRRRARREALAAKVGAPPSSRRPPGRLPQAAEAGHDQQRKPPTSAATGKSETPHQHRVRLEGVETSCGRPRRESEAVAKSLGSTSFATDPGTPGPRPEEQGPWRPEVNATTASAWLEAHLPAQYVANSHLQEGEPRPTPMVTEKSLRR